MPTVALNNNASANITGIAFVTGNGVGPNSFFRILRYLISSSGPGSVTFYNGVTALTGPMPVASGVALQDRSEANGVFDCSPGQYFGIGASGGISYGGYLEYSVWG